MSAGLGYKFYGWGLIALLTDGGRKPWRMKRYSRTITKTTKHRRERRRARRDPECLVEYSRYCGFEF